jgi:hypothetical protein
MQTTYGNGNLLSNQQQNLVNWNKGLNNQIGAALQQLGYNANNFSTTQSALQQIQLASQSAAGRLQAIQAGNQIAGMMVNETQALHGTIIAAEQARLNAIAKQENEKYQDEILYRNFFRNHSGNTERSVGMRATLFLLLMASMPLANAAGMMDTLVSQVQSASGGWMSTPLATPPTCFLAWPRLNSPGQPFS